MSRVTSSNSYGSWTIITGANSFRTHCGLGATSTRLTHARCLRRASHVQSWNDIFTTSLPYICRYTRRNGVTKFTGLLFAHLFGAYLLLAYVSFVLISYTERGYKLRIYLALMFQYSMYRVISHSFCILYRTFAYLTCHFFVC